MPRKIKLKKKDSYLVILGVFIGLLAQIAYDVFKNFTGEDYILTMTFAVIIAVICFVILGSFESE